MRWLCFGVWVQDRVWRERMWRQTCLHAQQRLFFLLLSVLRL